jgi:hypothetical protein
MPIVRQNLTDKFKHIVADTRYNVYGLYATNLMCICLSLPPINKYEP